MKFEFNPNLEYQNRAISSVVDLFDGQSSINSYFNIPGQMILDTGSSTMGIGNSLDELDLNDISRNLESVQVANCLPPSSLSGGGLDFTVEMETGTGKTYVFLKTIFELNKKYGFSKFIIVVPSVAIKEGVYKTLDITREHFGLEYDNVIYDYFIYDSGNLEQVRNFSLSNNIQIMVINIDAFRKSFSDPSKETKANIIHRPNDRLGGLKPIDFIRETNPVVIIDEPQSTISTANGKKAVDGLNPLFTLQYSATPKVKDNLIYKLDAIDAFSQGLVKQIEVASVKSVESHNDAYMSLKGVSNKDNRFTAKLELDCNVNGSVKRKTCTIKKGDELASKKLANRDVYDNYFVDEIYCGEGDEYIAFTNGKILRLGETVGDIDDDIVKEEQIRLTIKEHLDKELVLNKRGIKVLSLFFIDKVSNYRQYDSEGNPVKGKYAEMFEKHYIDLISRPKYKELRKDILDSSVDEVHNGYFSVDKKGKVKDSKGTGKEKIGKSKDDESTYNLIMRDKEKLLSFKNPLRFIFSHSALREGWDNPNVFQICTLNETSSTMKKRQEIGRGLRLAVNQDGERVKDKNLNFLTVMANESYEDFARNLQKEMEEDEGIKFGVIEKDGFAHLTLKNSKGKAIPIGKAGSEIIVKSFKESGYIDKNGKVQEKLEDDLKDGIVEVPNKYEEIKEDIIEILEKATNELPVKPAKRRRKVNVNKEILLGEEFKDFWNQIKYKTTYSVDYDTEVLVSNCIKTLKEELNVQPPKLLYTKAGVKIKLSGVETDDSVEEVIYAHKDEIALPDILTYLQNETYLTRKTLIRILTESETLELFKRNPQQYMEQANKIINRELNNLIMDGIKYHKLDDYYEQTLFQEDELFGYLESEYHKGNMIETSEDKTVYDYIVYDSDTEKEFARRLEHDDNVILYAKLPGWFKIHTPIGGYNPDWAIYLREHNENNLYFVVETKGEGSLDNLRGSEKGKIRCGKKHFAAIGNASFDAVDSYDMFISRCTGNE